MRQGYLRIWIFVFMAIFAACAPEFIDQPDRIVISADTSVRSGPGMNYDVIATLEAGTQLFLKASENDWHQVELPDGKTGWIFRGVTRQMEAQKVVALRDSRVRRGPGEQYGAFAIVKKGKTLESRGERGNWYLVDLIPGKSGWVIKRDVEKVTHRNLTVSYKTNAFEYPDINSKILLIIEPGTELIQLGKQNGFYQIRLSGGGSGWIPETTVGVVQEKTIQVKERTYLRRGANVGYTVIDTVEVGERLTYLTEDENWYEVRTQRGTKGWIYKDFVSTTISSGQTTADFRPVYVVTNQECNIRQGYGTDWKKIDRVDKGTLLMKIGQKDNWLRIKMPSERIGWIREDLVDYDVDVLITLEDCNLRYGYGTEFRIVGEASMGTPLVRISERDGWTRVYRMDGEIAWLRNDLFANLDSLLFANQDCNVRKGPAITNERITRITYGTPVFNLGKEKNWYKVRLTDPPEVGYIRDDLLNLTGNEFMANERVNIRKGASTDFEKIDKVPVHTRMQKLGEEGDWYNVKLSNGKEGWAYNKNVSYSFYPLPNYRPKTVIQGRSNPSGTQPSSVATTTTTPGYSVSYDDGVHLPGVYNLVRDKDITKIAINLRTQPDTSSSKITQIAPGRTLNLLKQEGSWYEVRTMEGTQGWVHESAFGISSTKDLWVINKCNIREGPGTNFPIKTVAIKDLHLTRLDKRGNWYNVRLADNSSGWVREDLVDEKKIVPAIDYNIRVEPAYGTAITISDTKLFKGPSHSYPTTRNLVMNTHVTTVGTYQSWSKVELFDGASGWIINDHLRKKTHAKIIAITDAEIHRSPDTQSALLRTIKTGNIFRPIEESGNWYRVVLIDGTNGWIASKDVEKLKYPPVFVRMPKANIRELPGTDSRKIAELKDGAKLIPLDDEQDWLFVKMPRGDKGWIYKNLVNHQKFPWLKVTKPAEVYKRPTAGSLLKGRVSQGEKIQALGKNDNWYKIPVQGGDIGWIYAGFVKEEFIGTQLIKQETKLRMGPGESYEFFGRALKGEQAKWLDSKSDWWQIQVQDSVVGWIKAMESKQLPMKKVAAIRTSNAFKEPGFNYPSVGTVVKNASYQPLQKKDNWYKIQLKDGVIGWAHMETFEASKQRMVFTLDVANIRRGPGVNYTIVQKVEPATDLIILGTEGEWYQVEIKDGVRGYIKKQLVFE